MKIHFHISQERFEELTWDAQIAMQDFQRGAEADLRGLRDMLAPFMQDEDGKWLEYEQAIGILGRIRTKETKQMVADFSMALKDFSIPKGTGNSSTSQSGTAETDQPG